MLVNLRIHVRVLYEKQKGLANKLEASELIAESRLERLLDKDKQIRQMLQRINDLKRQLDLQKLRLNLKIKDVKHAAEKEEMEFKNAMEKAAAVFENEKRKLERELYENRQEISQVQNRLEKSVQETTNMTENFKNFYEDYLRLEEDLSIIERELIPIQKQFQELAEAMNIEPEELHYRLDEFKKAVSKNESPENVKDLFVKALMVADKDEVTPKDGQVSSFSASSSCSASNRQLKPGSSVKIEHRDPSCPFSQKFFLEEMDNASKEAEENLSAKKAKVTRPKLTFKIPKFPFSQRKAR